MRCKPGWLVLLGVVAVLYAAQPVRAAAGPAAKPVLTETIGGGFVPAQVSFAELLPRIALYRDGRMFRVRPASLGGDGLEQLTVRTITPAALHDVLAMAGPAGVTSPAPDFGQPSVTDLPTTTFTLLASGTQTVVSAYALEFTTGLTAGQVAARKRLSAFGDTLDRIAAGTGAGSAPRRYLPTSLSVDPQPAPRTAAGATRKWPFGAIRSSCFGITAPARVKKILALAARATGATVWTSGGHRWQLSFRPDLPGQKPCS